MLSYDAAKTLRQQLEELPELLAYAHAALLPGSTPTNGRVSGATREAPLPCRLDVLSAFGPGAERVTDPSGDQDGQTPLLVTIATWAHLTVLERRDLAPGRSVGQQLAYLLDTLNWAIGQPWALDYASEIAAVHRAAARYAASPVSWRPVRIVCPTCQMLTMTERADGMRECANPDCWAILSRDEYASRAERTLNQLSEAA